MTDRRRSSTAARLAGWCLGIALTAALVALADWQAMVVSRSWYLAWLATPTAGAVILGAGRMKRKPYAQKVGIWLVASGVIGATLAGYLHRRQVTANQAVGERVVAALERHRSERGAYPEELADLVPEFLPAVPRPALGAFDEAPLYYMVFERTGKFALGLPAMAGAMLVFSDGRWSALPLPW